MNNAIPMIRNYNTMDLVVRYGDGRMERLSSGEIRIQM